MKNLKTNIIASLFFLSGIHTNAQLSYEPVASLTETKAKNYTLYYENGKTEESGTWKDYRNVGDYKRYYENGNIAQHFHFTESGKRDGIQKYYHKNGNIRAVGTWRNGQAKGEIRIYNEEGKLIETLQYEDGKYNSRFFELFNY